MIVYEWIRPIALLLLVSLCLAETTTQLRLADSDGNLVVISSPSAYMVNGAWFKNVTMDCAKEKYVMKRKSDLSKVLLLLDYLTDDRSDIPNIVFKLLLREITESAMDLYDVSLMVEKLNGYEDILASHSESKTSKELQVMQSAMHLFRLGSLEQLFDSVHELDELSGQYWDNPRALAQQRELTNEFLEAEDMEEEELNIDVDGLTTPELRTFLTGMSLASFAFAALSLGYVEHLECVGAGDGVDNCGGKFFLPHRLSGEIPSQIEIEERIVSLIRDQTKVEISNEDVTEVAAMLMLTVSRHPELVTKFRNGLKRLTPSPARSTYVLETMKAALATKTKLDSIFNDGDPPLHVVHERLLRANIPGQPKVSDGHEKMYLLLAQYSVPLMGMVAAAVVGEIL